MNVLKMHKSIWPQIDFALLSTLRQAHPSIKLVASWREAIKVSQSMMGRNSMGKHRLPKSQIPGLSVGYGHNQGTNPLH